MSSLDRGLCGARNAVRLAAVSLISAICVMGASPGAAAEDTSAQSSGPTPPTRYEAPTDAAVIDPFRLGSNPYGAGNRGVDFATETGAPVVAAAPGMVTFAGPVAGSLHVTVLHADGLRTTYSFLSSVAVRRGEVVEGGRLVGRAGGALHWSARAGDAYLDPMLLLGRPPSVHLAPDDIDIPGEGGERKAIIGLVGSLAGRAAWLAGAVSDEALRWAASADDLAFRATVAAAMAAAEAGEATSAILGVAAEAAVDLLERLGEECTWPDQALPPAPPGKSIVVLVGGLGSSSDNAAVWALEPALRQDGHDIVRFSYQGGPTSQRLYGPEDTTQDVRVSGGRLRSMLAELHAANPGVPVSVVAHSLGGLTSRVALAPGARDLGVKTLVTLATPHRGADLAGAVTGMLRVPIGSPQAVELVDRSALLGFDPKGPAVGQMAPGSPLLTELDAAGVPAGLEVTAIGGRHDAIVASTRARWIGARNTTVDPSGVLTEHDALPRSPEALVEVRRALGGQAPTCQGWLDQVGDVAIGHAVEEVESAARHGLGHISRQELGELVAESAGSRTGRFMGESVEPSGGRRRRGRR